MNDQSPRPLSVLFLQEHNGWWVALWLEANIAAQDKTLKGAWSALKDVLSGQLALDAARNRLPFDGKQPAPQWYWKTYKEARPLPLNSLDDGRELERDFDVQARQMFDEAA